MNLKFWKKEQKGLDQIVSDVNKLLKGVYQFQVHDGIITLIDDNPTQYLKDGYTANDDVYSIINRPLQMQTQARLALYTKDKTGKWVEINDHELCAFLDDVNPTMSMNDFRKAHLLYKFTIGNAFWYKPVLESGINRGKTIELWMTPSNNMRIIGGNDYMHPVGKYVLETNTTVEYLPEEIYHSKFFNPLFGENGSMYGLSPFKAAIKTISKQNEGALTELKQFTNQSPPYLLYRDVNNDMGGATSEQVEQIETMFKDYSKKYKSGMPKVLPDKFGMIQLGVSPVDLNILQSSQEGRRKLCNILCLPSELFNDKASSTYNNMIEARKAAWSDCILPNLTDFANDLTRFLINPVPEYKNEKLFFGFDTTDVQELQKDKGVMIGWMKQAGYTPNEMREATGANPDPNPLMDEPWMPMGETPLSQMTDTPLDETIPAKHFDYNK